MDGWDKFTCLMDSEMCSWAIVMGMRPSELSMVIGTAVIGIFLIIIAFATIKCVYNHM